MKNAPETLIRRIHDARMQCVLAFTGGGSPALAELLSAPGASRTVLEAVVPYSEPAMAAFLGAAPERACSPATAAAMAMAAFQRARTYAAAEDPEAEFLCGIACTAALATDRVKRGAHRAHLAVQTRSATITQSLELTKGRRSRREEERLVSRWLLNALAQACGVDELLNLELPEDEQIAASRTDAPEAWRELLMGGVPAVREGPEDDGSDSEGGEDEGAADEASETIEAIVVFPGAFNPLHEGHRRMALCAADLLGGTVEFEISIINVDKPPLDYAEMERRLDQFNDDRVVWLTRAPTFVEKARLFPGATFVVGADTILRIAASRYYASEKALQAAIQEIASLDCRFLVFGRIVNGEFQSLAQLKLPDPLGALCQEVPPNQFRHDISSTEKRSQQDPA